MDLYKYDEAVWKYRFGDPLIRGDWNAIKRIGRFQPMCLINVIGPPLEHAVATDRIRFGACKPVFNPPCQWT